MVEYWKGEHLRNISTKNGIPKQKVCAFKPRGECIGLVKKKKPNEPHT